METFSAEDIKTITTIERGGTPPATPPVSQDPPSNGATTAPQTPPAQTPTIPPAIQGGTPPAGAPAGTPPEGDQPGELDYVPIEELGFQDMEELQERLQRAAVLEQELALLQEYKNGPKFKSDRQKFIYDFANRYEGMEPLAARQLLEIADLDLKSFV
jgi:hypothetical protein